MHAESVNKSFNLFMPLGAQRVETTDARMLAATNADLAQRVQEGALREDLFFRLQVVDIHLPPLRERMEDLPDLVDVLLARLNRETGHRTTHLAADVLDCFRAYRWPGNVRELENRLMKAVALSQGAVITRDLFATDLCP